VLLRVSYLSVAATGRETCELTTEYLIQRGGGIGPVKPRQPSRLNAPQ
jgi:hypothetical protein